jgi:hypothetical protein
MDGCSNIRLNDRRLIRNVFAPIMLHTIIYEPQIETSNVQVKSG